MKQKILLVATVLTLVGLNVYLSQTPEVNVSDVLTSDVEAMAQQGTIDTPSKDTAPDMKLKKVQETRCNVCESGGDGCVISDQCCVSWGDCTLVKD